MNCSNETMYNEFTLITKTKLLVALIWSCGLFMAHNHYDVHEYEIPKLCVILIRSNRRLWRQMFFKIDESCYSNVAYSGSYLFRLAWMNVFCQYFVCFHMIEFANLRDSRNVNLLYMTEMCGNISVYHSRCLNDHLLISDKA